MTDVTTGGNAADLKTTYAGGRRTTMPEKVGSETYYDRQNRQQTRKTGYDQAAVDQANEQERSRAALSKAAAKGNTTSAADAKDPMPKQADYGSLGEYGEAMRKWRARRSQKAALKD